MKLGSSGGRSGSPSYQVPKPGLSPPAPPGWQGTRSRPPQWPSLPWFSSPNFLAFSRDRRPKSCVLHPPRVLCYLLAFLTSGESQDLPSSVLGLAPIQAQSWVWEPLQVPSLSEVWLSPSPRKRTLPTLTYPRVVMIPGQRPPLGLCEFSDLLHGSCLPSPSLCSSLPA